MIKTWNDESARELFETRKSRKIAQNIQKAAYRRLVELDAAKGIKDMAANPGNRLNLHDRGKHNGQWSVRINDQYRLFFRLGKW